MEDNLILKQLDTLNDSLILFKMQLNGFQQQINAIKKNIKKQNQTMKKKVEVEKPKTGKRAPSGFAKPTKVTKELCDFMNRPEGTEIARTEVTKALANYVKENNLLETNNKNKTKFKRIIPDTKLKSLLGLETEEHDLTYFSMQKYINKHFYGKEKEKVSEQYNN
jgi:chromatin remodeling complex protein RSC6